MEIQLEAETNTWSRAARRKLAREPSAAPPAVAQHDAKSAIPETVLLKATLRVLDGSIEMDWTYGRDRADFDGLWKSILANSGLINRGAGNGQKPDQDKKRKAVDELSKDDESVTKGEGA